MQDETNKIISLAEASSITGYTQDYLGFLCRTGKLEGQKIGRNWTTTRGAIDQMKLDSELTSVQDLNLSHSSLGGTRIPVKVLMQPEAFVEDRMSLVEEQASSDFSSEADESLSSNTVIPSLVEATSFMSSRAEPRDLSIPVEMTREEVEMTNESDPTFEKTFVVGLPISLFSVKTEPANEKKVESNNIKDKDQTSFSRNSPAYLSVTTFAITLSLLASIFWIKPDLFDQYLNNESVKIERVKIPTRLVNEKEIKKDNEGQVLAAQSVTQARVTPAVLTQFELEKLIMESLAEAESLGFFRGPQGPAGTNGTSGTSPSGPVYIQPYIPSVPTSSNPGGTLAGFTDLSSQRFITDDATINDQLTVNGTANFEGDVEITGTLTAGGITGTIDPGLTEGSIIFQGGSGLDEDNANFFWDDASDFLGIGTSTPAYTLDVQGDGPIISIETTSTNTDAAIRMLSDRLGVDNEWTFGPAVGSSHQNFAFLSTTGGITVMSLSQTGQLSLGTETINASAILQADSTTQGFLPPRLTTAQKNAIGSPAEGLTLFDSDLNKLNVYNGTEWKNVGSAEIGGEITSGTTGSILFVGAGATIAQDNANFFWDDTTNKLGLGTAAPEFLFDVRNNSSSTAGMQLKAVQTTPFNDEVSLKFGAYVDDADSAIGYAWIDTEFVNPGFSFANYPLLLNKGGGRVGVGTDTSPDYQLEISNGAFGTVDPSFALSDGSVAHGLTTIANTDVLLHVAPLDSSNGGARISAVSDTDAQALSIRGIIGSTDPTDTTAAILFTGAKSNGTTGIADLGASETVLQVVNNDDTAALTILGSGNVGIGTVTPATKLNVAGGDIRIDEVSQSSYQASNALVFRSWQNGTPLTWTLRQQAPDAGTQYFEMQNYGGTPMMVMDSSGGLVSQTSIGAGLTGSSRAADFVHLSYTSGLGSLFTGSHSSDIQIGNNWMRFNHLTGNVGIGSDTSPAAALTVGADTTAGVANGAGDAYIQNDLEVDGTLTVAGATTYSGALSVITTTSPQLTVGYDSSNKFTTAVASDGGTTWAMLGTDADLNIDFSGATDGDFSINTDDLFVDTSSGYVGIGTVGPGSQLDVIKDDNDVDSIARFYPNNLTQGIGISYRGILGLGTDSSISIEANGTGRISLANATIIGGGSFTSSAKLAVYGSQSIGTGYQDINPPTDGLIVLGSVGIGTSSPDAKLEIAGNMTQAAWGLNGIQLQGTAATFTDSDSAGTRTDGAISSLGQSTFAATNAVTTTNAYGLYLAGAPISGTNQTLTNTSALYIGAAATVDGTGATPTNSYGLYVNAQTGATNNYAAQFDGGSVNIRSGNTLVLYRTDNAISGSIFMNNSNEIQFSGGIYTNSGSINLGAGSIFGSNPIITSQTGNSVTLQATPNGSPTFKNVVVDTVGVSSTGYLFAIRNNGTEKISVDYNGNLGLGTTSPTALLDVNNTTTSTITVAANARVLNLQGAFTEAGSGVHSRIVGLEITPPTITAGAATVTNTASLYISDAPTATVTATGANYSLWVDAGNSRFDGALQLNGGSFPSTGEGMELIASNDIGYIQVYNRDTSSWGDLQINTEDATFTNWGGFTTFQGANVGIGGADYSPDASLEVG